MVRNSGMNLFKTFLPIYTKFNFVQLHNDRLGGSKKYVLITLLKFYSFCSSINQLFKL